MDPDVIAQLEEQIRIMNELLAQQNAMMASQLGAMKGAAGKMDAASTSYVSRMNSASQSTTKYMESQEKVRDQANASVEKWSNRVRDSERAIAGFNLVLGNAAGIVGSFGTALLSAEKGFSKYGATADAAAGAAQSLASALPIVGQALGGVVGAVGKVASKVVGDALKLTDSIINLREETVKVAGALPVSSEGLLKLANEAKYFGENIQVLGKITQGIGTGLTSLGMTAGQGATKFMEMANVTEETRQRFGKLGISQEELTQMQATYIKQQQSSGLALTLQTRSVEQLRKQSLKYAEDLNALTGLTGKAADQLRAEQEQAAAVLQEKIAQRQDMMELQRLKQDGRTAEAAELEAKIQATAKFRDTMANLVGPEQAAQMMRVVRTGVYDNISGPLANMGLDFQEIRNQLQQGKDGMKVAAEFAGEVRGAQDRMLGPNGLGGAALFLDDEQFKQLGGNLESLSRLSDTYGKSMTEMLEAEKKAQAERQKGSPMDDAIEKARSAERALQQKYQEFLIDGIKKAAALLNATDLNKLAADAMALATKAAYVGLGILTVATGALLFAKRREVVASREAREAQKEPYSKSIKSF